MSKDKRWTCSCGQLNDPECVNCPHCGDMCGFTLAPDDLNDEERLDYEERAAIMEYHGCLPRKQAEAEALADVQRQEGERDGRSTTQK